MSEIKCIKCDSSEVVVARNMRGDRKCTKCFTTWLPEEDYKAFVGLSPILDKIEKEVVSGMSSELAIIFAMEGKRIYHPEKFKKHDMENSYLFWDLEHGCFFINLRGVNVLEKPFNPMFKTLNKGWAVYDG